VRPKYAKPDRVQESIVADLRKLGAVVWITASLPTPVLDIIVFWRGRIGIVELKEPGDEQDFTPGEVKSIAALKAVGIEVIVATCAEDVIEKFMAL